MSIDRERRQATAGARHRSPTRRRAGRRPGVTAAALALLVAVVGVVTVLAVGSSGESSSGAGDRGERSSSESGAPSAGDEAGSPPGALAGSPSIIFDEGFDEDLDPQVWADCYFTAAADGCTNQWNEELQWYLPEQRAVADGVLTITLEDRPYETLAGETFPYRSAMVTTQPGFEFTHGYVEFSVDYPVGQGVWPQLWLLPSAQTWPPELDVLEVVGDEPDTAYFNVHYPQEQALTKPDGSLVTNSPGAATIEGLSEGFHTFGLLWQPDRLEWYVDGELHHRFTDADRIPDEPMYLVMNLATGGEWAGAPDESTPLPAQLVIDRVRVWQ